MDRLQLGEQYAVTPAILPLLLRLVLEPSEMMPGQLYPVLRRQLNRRVGFRPAGCGVRDDERRGDAELHGRGAAGSEVVRFGINVSLPHCCVTDIVGNVVAGFSVLVLRSSATCQSVGLKSGRDGHRRRAVASVVSTVAAELGSLRLDMFEMHQRLSTACRRRVAFSALLLALLGLVAVILKPDLHLGGRQADHLRQLVSLGRRQVLLLLEAAFQLVDLNLASFHTQFYHLIQ